MTGTRRSAAISAAFVTALLGAWQALASWGSHPSYVYGPLQIAQAVAAFAASGDLASQIGPSLFRALSGFAIGAAIGVVLGWLAGISPAFRDLFDLTQSFAHAIPKIALFPALAVVLGFTDQSRITIIAISAFFPAYLNALNGAIGIDPRLMWVARNAGASRLRSFVQVVVPASLPRTLVGLRISLMVSFVVMVATEVVGFSNGLGAGLLRAYRNGDYANMYAGIAVVAVCGLVANAALHAISVAACRGAAAGSAAS